MSKRKKRDLGNRYETSYKSKDKGGMRKKGIFNYDLLEKEIKHFSIKKEGMKKLIIVPYKVNSKNHPLVHSGDKEIGDYDYVMDIFVHRFVGAQGDDYVCLKKNYGKACPICEELHKAYEEGDKEKIGSLYASRRCFYNVLDVKNMDVGLQIFHASHKFFEKKLIRASDRYAPEGSYVRFADIEEGKIILFDVEAATYKNSTYYEYEAFAFENRDKVITIDEVDEYVDKTISFDELLIVPTYEELQKVLYEVSDDEEESYDADEGDKENRTAEEDERRKKNREDKEEKIACPNKFVFGEEFDEYEECDECEKEIWRACKKEKRSR